MGALSVEAFLEEKSGFTSGGSISRRRKKLGALPVEAFLEEQVVGALSVEAFLEEKKWVHFQWKHF